MSNSNSQPRNDKGQYQSNDGTTIAGVEWHLGHFFTGREDPTIANVNVLSKPAEWHAVMVGILAVLAPQFLPMAGLSPSLSAALGPGFALSYVAGRFTKDLARYSKNVVTPQHLKDAMAEPAYTSAGYVLALAVAELGQALPL